MFYFLKNCFKREGLSNPCYSILAGSESPQVLQFFSLLFHIHTPGTFIFTHPFLGDHTVTFNESCNLKSWGSFLELSKGAVRPACRF